MKKYGLIFSSALLIAALMLHGQEAAPPFRRSVSRAEEKLVTRRQTALEFV